MLSFIVVCVLLFILFLLALYDVIFSSNQRYMGDDSSLPHGELYDPYHDTITKCVREVLEVPYEEVKVQSHDGYVLSGKYYHLKDDAPMIMFFHGYRCSAIRDGNGIFLYIGDIKHHYPESVESDYLKELRSMFREFSP